MYYMAIWDKSAAADGKNASMGEIELDIEFSRLLFGSDPAVFPILSGLSFDDYDIFSGLQLDQLSNELIGASKVDPSISDKIHCMVNLVSEAKRLGKSILFDPFRVS